MILSKICSLPQQTFAWVCLLHFCKITKRDFPVEPSLGLDHSMTILMDPCSVKQMLNWLNDLILQPRIGPWFDSPHGPMQTLEKNYRTVFWQQANFHTDLSSLLKVIAYPSRDRQMDGQAVRHLLN